MKNDKWKMENESSELKTTQLGTSLPTGNQRHCFRSRAWIVAEPTKHGRSYLPPQSAPAFLKGHRINDQMSSLLSAPMKPADVLDMTSIYVYDSLAV